MLYLCNDPAPLGRLTVNVIAPPPPRAAVVNAVSGVVSWAAAQVVVAHRFQPGVVPAPAFTPVQEPMP